MDKKLKNELFRVAVDYLFREKKVGSQKELAEKIGITEPSLSRVMNGGRTVSDKTLHKMNEAFGGIFNMAYFRGEDPHCMLMEDLLYYKQHPEERLIFEKPNGDNPALLDSAKAVSDSSPIDPSSIMNAAISAQMQTIESLKSEKATLLEAHARELKVKDDLIQSLRDQLAAKEQLIAEQKARLIEYRHIIDSHNGISDYPFPIGAAEHSSKPNI
jgi:transcriptional regulator with XRE-family HTH domain